MRRMLDPKEAGGSVKQYCHFIEIDSNDGSEIYCNYYSKDKTKLTTATIVSAIKGKRLICNGYVKINGNAKNLEFIYVVGNELAVRWVDLTDLSSSVKIIGFSSISDIVFPVD